MGGLTARHSSLHCPKGRAEFSIFIICVLVHVCVCVCVCVCSAQTAVRVAKRLRDIFETAVECEPSIVILDDLHNAVPNFSDEEEHTSPEAALATRNAQGVYMLYVPDLRYYVYVPGVEITQPTPHGYLLIGYQIACLHSAAALWLSQ